MIWISWDETCCCNFSLSDFVILHVDDIVWRAAGEAISSIAAAVPETTEISTDTTPGPTLDNQMEINVVFTNGQPPLDPLTAHLLSLIHSTDPTFYTSDENYKTTVPTADEIFDAAFYTSDEDEVNAAAGPEEIVSSNEFYLSGYVVCHECISV